MIVCFFGDSLVNGVADPQGLGWPGRLLAEARQQHGLDLTGYNLGIRRNCSRDITARFADEAKRRIFPGMDLKLVYAFGAVDVALVEGEVLVPEEESLANARRILTESRELGETVMVSPPTVADAPHGQRIVELAGKYAALCQELEVPFLSIVQDCMDSEAYMGDLISGDGIHPAAAGYNLIFRLVNSWDGWKNLVGLQ